LDGFGGGFGKFVVRFLRDSVMKLLLKLFGGLASVEDAPQLPNGVAKC
jgi:hypothetical protein